MLKSFYLLGVHSFRLLPVLKKVESQKIPWSKLRMMSKEERSAARKEAEIKFDNSVDTNAK